MSLNIPSDKLYKVMAFGGVAMLLAGAGTGWREANSVRQETKDLLVEYAGVNADASALLAEKTRGHAPPCQEVALVQRENAVADAKSRGLENDYLLMWFMLPLGFLFSCLGALVSYSGFRLWYLDEERKARS